MEFAKKAQRYADRMLDVLVKVAEDVEAPEAARVSAAAKVLDRVLGTGRVDVSALHHTEIVYRSAAQLRQELINRGVPEVLLYTAEIRQALINRGVPEVLLDYSPKDANGK
ncbi:MAG: hypothetical protein ACLQF4_02495 [Xanthobacteraceae bacterium]